ncbi:MAG: PadR family transcriptional regulator [Micrococcales bacterium]|nr:PadR family transcriptional regulator [Micrococcales bacterium]
MGEYKPTRVTQPTLKVAAYLQSIGSTPTWGLQICEGTGLGSGSVYAVLDRFETYGWVESFWEEDNSRRGARRRLYKTTSLGHKSLKQLLSEREVSQVSIKSVRMARA